MPSMRSISNTAGSANAVETFAARQRDLVTRDQMHRLGLSDKRIASWVRRGRIRRVLPGVYVVGQPQLGERGRIHAAVLACGPGAVASHRSAAFLLEIGERSPRVVDVIVPGQRGRKVDGIRVHDVPNPAPHELRLVDGILCTSAARTIVDLAGTYGEQDLNETFERAATENRLDLPAIETVLDAVPRRRGAPCLRRVIEGWRPVAETANFADARSLFEVKLLPLVAAAKLPMPLVNAPVRTLERVLEVDLLWPDQRFVVEADSRRHHAIEVAFERDRRRDHELMDIDHTVLRVTWHEAEREPEAVFATVRTQLERRAPKRST
jgi:Transcriptional regulator, AbiEi antitoxin/Protein of unknown function (DUF559)